MKKRYCFLSIVLLSYQSVIAQFSDSLNVSIGTTATVASKSYQPLWIIANQFGVLQNRKSDASTHIRITNRHLFGKEIYITPDSSIRNFSLQYGLDLYNNNHFSSTFFKEAFIKFAYRSLELRGGRYAEIIGENDPSLSSGSLGVSGNALPIPQISLMLRYVNVPLTNGWVQVKGQLSHGWFGRENAIKKSYLHQKSIYLKAGKNALQFYAGLTHYAQWGGTHPFGKLPSRFSDLVRIALGKSGRGGGILYQQGAGAVDTVGGIGNHIVIPDFGFIFRKNENTFTLYTQNIFDKGPSPNANIRGTYDAFRIFRKDRLLGFKWQTSKPTVINGAAIEWIYTKEQGGPIQYVGRDNYYNNAVFVTGWQYKGRIIGTPLFIRREDAAIYNLNLAAEPLDVLAITSNRISGVHFAIKGSIKSNLSYRILATHLKHFGNYYNDAVFAERKTQNHLLVETTWMPLTSVTITAAAGSDFGQIAKTTGGRLGIEWNLF